MKKQFSCPACLYKEGSFVCHSCCRNPNIDPLSAPDMFQLRPSLRHRETVFYAARLSTEEQSLLLHALSQMPNSSNSKKLRDKLQALKPVPVGRGMPKS